MQEPKDVLLLGPCGSREGHPSGAVGLPTIHGDIQGRSEGISRGAGN